MLKPVLNPNYTTRWDGPILIVEDFLANIDEFRESLWNRGEFLHASRNKSVVDVGPAHDWRQLISSEELPAEFNLEIAKLQRTETPVTTYATNRFYSDMQIESRKWRSSNYPHTDHVVGQGPIPIVFNLWLHDGGGGTGFYTYDDHYTSSAMSEDLRFFAENHRTRDKFPEASRKFMSDFQGDDEWKLWKVAEMKKNRAFVYCGDFWHRVLIPEDQFLYPNARFSFISFSATPSPRFLEESGSLPFLKGE